MGERTRLARLRGKAKLVAGRVCGRAAVGLAGTLAIETKYTHFRFPIGRSFPKQLFSKSTINWSSAVATWSFESASIRVVGGSH